MTVPAARIRVLRDEPPRAAGKYVLYWMIAARRLHFNFALDRALELARALERPLVVLEALRTAYPWASDRMHHFVLEGMADNRAYVATKAVTYFPYVEPAHGAASGLVTALAEHACAVVTDDYPCFFLPRMVSRTAEKLEVRFEAIDGNGILPLSFAEGRSFTTAYSYRRFMQKNLERALEHLPSQEPLRRASLPELAPSALKKVRARFPEAALDDREALVASLPIDHTVTRARSLTGGHHAARQRLKSFLANDLGRYDEQRNHPDEHATSGLSPWLHFGHIGAHELLHAPLLSTLVRLATPNVIGLFAMTVVIGYDGFILGRLGPDALAGIALVFPLSMLMLQMSAGGIGGASTAAVARALGAGRSEDASRLAQHALLIAFAMAVLFMALMLGFGRGVFGAMGGRGAALDAALAYSNVLFTGALVIWSTNVLASVVRGAGNMLLPSLMLMATAAIHLVLCPLLVFGWGPFGGLGIAGAAVSTLSSNAVAALVMGAYLLRRGGAVQLQRAPWRLRVDLLREILRVGVPASLSPVLSNASIAAATAVVGSYGVAALAGYGVAARLEYILVPIAFGFGTALTTMVATNMGAGQVARAVRVTWIGGAVVAGITGLIGAAAALAPSLWMNLFTADAAVRAFGADYLNIVGGCYGLFGLGLALFFASQGAGRMLWPLIGSAARLVIVAVGGWACVHLLQAPANGYFAVVAVSLAVYALTIAAAIRFGGWKK